ncbi:hypothetical protein [Clostridium sp. Marseille-QA1073]
MLKKDLHSSKLSQEHIEYLEKVSTHYKKITINLIEKLSLELNVDILDVFLYFYNRDKDQ